MATRDGTTQYTINSDPSPADPTKMRLGNDGDSFYQIDKDGNKVFFAKQTTRAETDNTVPVLADRNNKVRLTNAIAKDLVIQLDATLSLPVGFTSFLQQGGAGAPNLKSVAGVTINGVDNADFPLIGGIGAAIIQWEVIAVDTILAWGAI